MSTEFMIVAPVAFLFGWMVGWLWRAVRRLERKANDLETRVAKHNGHISKCLARVDRLQIDVRRLESP